MESQARSIASDHSPEPQPGPDVLLAGPQLALAWASWVAVTLLSLGLWLISIPVEYASETAVTREPAVQLGFASFVWSVHPHAAISGGLSAVVVVGYSVVAAVILWHKPRDRVALVVALMLVTFGVAFSPNLEDLGNSQPRLTGLIQIVRTLGNVIAPVLFLCLFPDGRFRPGWTRGLAVISVVGGLGALAGSTVVPDWGGLGIWIGSWGAGLAAQVQRYRTVSGTIQRQQTKWVVAGFAAMSLGVVAMAVLGEIDPALTVPGSPGDGARGAIAILSALLLPASIGVAILRYHLLDIDLLINRALVYGALTAIVVALYVLVIGYLSALFRTGSSLPISLVATGVVAVTFQPLRERLQRGINRLMFGQRDEPYAVLSRLNRWLSASVLPDALLPTIVETIARALKLPYVAIALELDGALQPVATFGTAQDILLSLPLVYQGETLGQLRVCPRQKGESFSGADRRLLDDLAHQVGIVAHSVRLTADLQRSRERIVTAAEEERRRLRRDLHDGLGPTLASVAHRLDTARIQVRSDPDAAVEMLDQLKGQVKETIQEIRRLVYGLRPPVLDELGLVAALRQQAAEIQSNRGIEVVVKAPETLPPLSAAVEVAAYRIGIEALGNVARHANARRCALCLEVVDGPALSLMVTDDGRGLGEHDRLGVGTMSMRERAAELGGTCAIAPAPGAGLCVHARLPISRETSNGSD